MALRICSSLSFNVILFLIHIYMRAEVLSRVQAGVAAEVYTRIFSTALEVTRKWPADEC